MTAVVVGLERFPTNARAQFAGFYAIAALASTNPEMAKKLMCRRTLILIERGMRVCPSDPNVQVLA